MGEGEIAKALQTSEAELRRAEAFLKATTDAHAPKGPVRKAFHRSRVTARKLAEKLRERIPRLRKRLEAIRRGGAARAVRWALHQAGTTETPSGSNWGVPVQDWIKYTGYTGPVPWCGCFACFAVVAKGKAKIPSRIRLGFAGYIVSDARANRNGLRAVSAAEAKAGDIFTIGTSHIGVITGPVNGGYVPTIEGNTSPGEEGSQYNGGCVARKRRATSTISVFARPAY